MRPGKHGSRSLSQAVERVDLIFQSEIFPALQSDWHVAVLPDEVVKPAQAEAILLLAVGIGKKLVDLQFADLVRDRLAGSGGKGRSLGVGCFGVHRDRI